MGWRTVSFVDDGDDRAFGSADADTATLLEMVRRGTGSAGGREGSRTPERGGGSRVIVCW